VGWELPWGGALRVFLAHHATGSVNSVCHPYRRLTSVVFVPVLKWTYLARGTVRVRVESRTGHGQPAELKHRLSTGGATQLHGKGKPGAMPGRAHFARSERRAIHAGCSHS
jgi:hypothetical protein